MTESGAVATALRLRSSLRGEPSLDLDTTASVPAATADDIDEAVDDDGGGGDDGEEGLAVERPKHIFCFSFFSCFRPGPWGRRGGYVRVGGRVGVLRRKSFWNDGKKHV